MDADFINFMKWYFIEENALDKDGNVICENVKNDRGGLTKFGIDQRSHPDIKISELTYEKALDQYWNEYNLYQCRLLPVPIRYPFFDAAENQGYKQAVRNLQFALHLERTGFLEDEERKAIATGDHFQIAIDQILRRKEVNLLIIQNIPDDIGFLDGWTNRCDSLIEWVQNKRYVVEA